MVDIRIEKNYIRLRTQARILGEEKKIYCIQRQTLNFPSLCHAIEFDKLTVMLLNSLNQYTYQEESHLSKDRTQFHLSAERNCDTCNFLWKEKNRKRKRRKTIFNEKILYTQAVVWNEQKRTWNSYSTCILERIHNIVSMFARSYRHKLVF